LLKTFLLRYITGCINLNTGWPGLFYLLVLIAQYVVVRHAAATYGAAW
jgi:hypothetical protein